MENNDFLESHPQGVKADDTREGAYNWLFGHDMDVESIRINRPMILRMFEKLLPGKEVIFVDDPTFFIHSETGTLLPIDYDVNPAKMKKMEIKPKILRTHCDFNFVDFSSKFLYVMQWRNIELVSMNSEAVEFYCAEYNITSKKTVTFTIDDEVLQKFNKVAEDMAINKSKFIENKIREFVEKNG